MVVAVLVLVRLWDDLRTAEGRSLLLTSARALLGSPDTYIAFYVLLVNSAIYAVVIKCVYPTGGAIFRGLGKAIMLAKGDEFATHTQPGGIRHFFIIFLLPVFLLQAGFAEYRWLTAWLLP